MPLYKTTMYFRDDDGDEASRDFWVNAADQATAEATLAALATDVDGFILGRIFGLQITVPVPLPGGLKVVAAAGADVEVQASFTFNSDIENVKPTITIPTFDKDNFTITGGIVDVTGAVSAFLQKVILQGVSDYRGANIASLKSGIEWFRNRKKSR